ncbi:hypothetical protein PGT21_026836 [Puccinia graminis f. sp. tritici]|uniref:Uncharacterized protein n=1 Tax=Puccinia graminis f. sp. tritici TaxID=56615 RepID=A0A5B0MY25_PUCGR|nr:hypothetical protein PGT21_026836 [Puccinia graminis f. sp. tritici]
MKSLFHLPFAVLLTINFMCQSIAQVLKGELVGYPYQTNEIRLYTDGDEPYDTITCYVPDGNRQWRVINDGQKTVHLKAVKGIYQKDIFSLEPGGQHDVRDVLNTENLTLKVISIS